ncbi:UDP-N-acetylmuramoyl-L-alanyl-D-glutamate--2,6-diaminopimelate ligase [Luteolibacter pohnpeiensis]|uniref:UDP-N-acetylmuramoyl-L-alanyl-D-glutamate--2,6-diaminopimelate ligase n=1 Tax=Luteolibacter pohnpeiensis TaxID=454153 RepID=A0A934VRQ3_9BACT|nr:UDP-N-acetylmuramoyl-L-alanyl-D-glutamate--2,6-diaminopimelate ligase [Luteolibacter pohnpeiensis]MBK1883461.1 UDP-N-acetylmuramoyl-L-alanyl-D-glutamate--2,6-diaminopimelate ligase [Luteolibacter pohnpeiensis]
MNLRDLTTCLSRLTVSGPLDLEIASLTASSKHVEAGTLFAAIRGTTVDGHQFIEGAIAAGAVAILAETAPPKDLASTITWIHVPDSRLALSLMASEFYGNPWKDFAVAGVTGTNGKTTTTFLIHHIMKAAWHRAGLLGTILTDDGETIDVAKHTTPGSLELSELLGRMRDNGCRGVALEVSSHGIHQKRTAAIGFDAAVFTNLTQDHLDYHGTIEAYFQAKADWFEALAADPRGKKSTAIINIDDAYGADLAASLEGRLPMIRFGFGVHCDFRANNLRQNARGMEFELQAKGRTFLVRSPLIGRFNVYNILAAIAAANACGIRPRDAIAALADSPQVPGRLENVGNAGGATVFVDYAHTPDALENVCRTLRDLNPRRLITVFGCGGDRDNGKRPLMAAAASRHSDACIITSDNPRSEDPAEIIRQVEAGMTNKNYRSIVDRAEAIDFAIRASRSGDIVLIAGKGHETYQQFADKTIDFDDRKHASKSLRDRAQELSEQR